MQESLKITASNKDCSGLKRKITTFAFFSLFYKQYHFRFVKNTKLNIKVFKI